MINRRPQQSISKHRRSASNWAARALIIASLAVMIVIPISLVVAALSTGQWTTAILAPVSALLGAVYLLLGLDLLSEQ